MIQKILRPLIPGKLLTFIHNCMINVQFQLNPSVSCLEPTLKVSDKRFQVDCGVRCCIHELMPVYLKQGF